jgi:hypothetical protein
MFLAGGVLRHKHTWGAKLTARKGTAWLEGVITGVNKEETTDFAEDADEPPPFDAAMSRVSVPPRGRSKEVPRKIKCTHDDQAVPVLIEVGAGRDHLVFGIECSFERGRLRVGNGVFEVWESVPCPYAEKFRSLARVRDGFGGPTGYFANMLADAVACYRDPAHSPAGSAEDGLRVIEYLNSVRKWR